MFCIKDVQKHLRLFAKIEPTNFHKHKNVPGIEKILQCIAKLIDLQIHCNLESQHVKALLQNILMNFQCFVIDYELF